VGKEALLKQMETGVTKRFVQLLVDMHNLEHDPWPQGNEPIFRDNLLAGWTTSTAYGYYILQYSNL
jgi:glycine cleavage system aminomethyltransferase T